MITDQITFNVRFVSPFIYNFMLDSELDTFFLYTRLLPFWDSPPENVQVQDSEILLALNTSQLVS